MRYKAVLFLLCFVMCFNTDADIENIRYSIEGGVSSLRNRHIQHRRVETNGHPTDFYTCKNGTWELLAELDGWRKPSATATKTVKGHGWVGVTVKGEVNRTQGGSWETFELDYGGEAIQEIGWLSAAIPIPRTETVSTELYDYVEHAKEDTGTFEFKAGTASTTAASSAGVQVALGKLTVTLTPGGHTGGSTSRTMSPSTYTVEFKKSPNDAQEGAPCGPIINLPPGSGSGSTPPTDNTPNCPDCTSDCSSPCSCTNSGTCGGSVAYHPCGEHETSVSGNHSYGTYTCGIHSGYKCQESHDHKTYISVCTETDSNGQTCNNTSGYWECTPHSHTYPSPPPPPSVTCSRPGCDASEDHRVPPCSACGKGYWTCGDYASWSKNQHRVRTCRRAGCGNTWQRCISSTPACKVASGQGCWAADP